ncbi:MAG TPA: hypothetical protein VGM56_02305 [Byssovorax sp.]|jgi:hypothetical protein
MRALGLLASSLFVVGCVTGAPASQFPTADDALGRMKATYACTNGVQGEAKLDVFTKEIGRVRGQAYVTAVNPDRVRIDIVSFGTPLYTLTSDGKQFSLLDTKEHRFLEGPASPCNLARLTQVPIPGHALVALLRGEAPVLVHKPADASIRWESGHYVVSIPSTRDASEEIWVEVNPADVAKPWAEQRLRVVDVKVVQRGVELYHAELAHHEVAKTAPPTESDGIDPSIPPSGPACDAELPRSLRVTVPTQPEPMIFQYKSGAWNPPILANVFSQTRPGGVHGGFADCQ